MMDRREAGDETVTRDVLTVPVRLAALRPSCPVNIPHQHQHRSQSPSLLRLFVELRSRRPPLLLQSGLRVVYLVCRHVAGSETH